MHKGLDEPSIEDRELKFINLVKSHPYLYDKSHIDSKDLLKKEAAWKSISQVMGYSVSDCQKRWVGLREKYARERKLKKSDPFHPEWHLYNDISFLDKHVRERNYRFNTRPILPKTENIESGLDLSSTNMMLDADLSNDMNYVEKLELVDSTFNDDVTVDNMHPICLSSSSAVEYSQKSEMNSNGNIQTSITTDEDLLFGQSIAAELKKITSRRKKIKLKSDIFKLLYDYECDDDV